ncbi:hypothetical protein RF11_14619 [Thelohanellus kitauei]|uniref:E3 ubiquitin protein ligase n=1 Tax=Thelohanellus kitauei TaxID=669202 RepID=A0A0C2INK2_THEKT|nr:hypothetical protein RF11_14619 [Thelohanellus kitauei]
MSKRSLADANLFDPVEDTAKKLKPCDLPIIRNVTSSDDLNVRVLVIQNSNLDRRCRELKESESELQSKLQELTSKCNKQECIIAILLEAIIHNNQDVRALVNSFGEFCPSPKECQDNFESAYSFVQKFAHSSEQIISEEIKMALSDNLSNIVKLVDIVSSCHPSNNTFGGPNGHQNSDISQRYLEARSRNGEYDFIRHRYAACQEEIIKLQNQIDELTCDLTRSSHRYDVLYNNYTSVTQKSTNETVVSEPKQKPSEVSDELKAELSSYREIASARLEELKNLQNKYRDVLRDYNQLKFCKVLYMLI